jgi:hypothetical protein
VRAITRTPRAILPYCDDLLSPDPLGVGLIGIVQTGKSYCFGLVVCAFESISRLAEMRMAAIRGFAE